MTVKKKGKPKLRNRGERLAQKKRKAGKATEASRESENTPATHPNNIYIKNPRYAPGVYFCTQPSSVNTNFFGEEENSRASSTDMCSGVDNAWVTWPRSYNWSEAILDTGATRALVSRKVYSEYKKKAGELYPDDLFRFVES